MTPSNTENSTGPMPGRLSISPDIEKLDPQDLEISPYNVRKTNVKGGDWEGFVDSVSRGLEQLPIVTPSNQVIVGQRRWKAAQEAQLKEIPVHRLTKEPSPIEAILLSLNENEHRRNLTLDDRLNAVEALMKLCNNNQSKVAKLLDKKKSTVSILCSLLEVRKMAPGTTEELGIVKARLVKKILSHPSWARVFQNKHDIITQAIAAPTSKLRQFAQDLTTSNLTDLPPLDYIKEKIRRTGTVSYVMVPYDVLDTALEIAKSEGLGVNDWLRGIIEREAWEKGMTRDNGKKFDASNKHRRPLQLAHTAS